MPGLNWVPASNGVSVFDPVANANILEKEESGFCSIVNEAVQLFFLLNHPDSIWLQLAQSSIASVDNNFMENELLVRRVESEGETRIRLHTDGGSVLLSDVDKSLASGRVDFNVEQEKKDTGGRLLFKRIIALLDIDGSCPARDWFNHEFLVRGRQKTEAAGEQKAEDQRSEMETVRIQPKTWTITSLTKKFRPISQVFVPSLKKFGARNNSKVAGYLLHAVDPDARTSQPHNGLAVSDDRPLLRRGTSPHSV